MNAPKLLLAVVLSCLSILAHAESIRSANQFAKLAKGEESLSVIVALKAPQQQVQSRSYGKGWVNFNDYVEAAQQNLANEMGWQNFNDIVRYRTVPGVAKQVTKKELKRLLKAKSVHGVYENIPMKASLVDSAPMVGAYLPGLKSNGGSGQVVAVLDDGVDSTHPFLKGKVVAEACFSESGTCPNGRKAMEGKGAGKPCANDCSHGTHVAGIVVGRSNRMTGVAPNAKLVAIRVLDKKGGSLAAVIGGLDWLYANSRSLNLSAVNLSLGGGEFTADCDRQIPFMGDIFQRFINMDVPIIVASGNEGYTRALASPACLTTAISVGAIDKKGRVAGYSNANNQLSIVAPGGAYQNAAGLGAIRSSVPGGYASYQGTSMAAPHVAGAWALLKGAYPNASYDDIYTALITKAPRVRDTRNQLLYPSLSLGSAQKYLKTAAKDDNKNSKPKPAPKPSKPKDAGNSARPNKPSGNNCEQNFDGISVRKENCKESGIAW